MKLIGYFGKALTIAEIQEIRAAQSKRKTDEGCYEIQARASAGAAIVLYCIRPFDEKSGSRGLKTLEDANSLLEKLLINPDTIDLRKLGSFVCRTEWHYSPVLLRNEPDDFDGSEKPVVTRVVSD